MSKQWTEDEVAVLKATAHMGAEACAREIWRQTGAERTPSACRMQASRCGIPMVRFEICPGCGRKTQRLNRQTGLCKPCNYKQRTDEQKELHTKLVAELRSGEEESEEKNELTEYRKWNRRISRLRADARPEGARQGAAEGA